MMLTLLITAVVGSLFGVIVGLLPGIGMTAAMISLFFYLTKFDPIVVCCFYISCLTVSQYMGSVSATMLGVLGEASSIPALAEGYEMNRQGRGREALAISALGSWIGSFFAVVLAVVLASQLQHVFVLNYTEIKLAFFGLLFLLMIMGSSNRWWISVAMIVVGYMVGKIGWNPYSNQTWGTMGIDVLASGIPEVTVLVCFYSLPLLLAAQIDQSHSIKNAEQNIRLFEGWKLLPKLAVIRGSVVGFLSGLIPFLTYVASTKFAWSVERFLDKKNYKLGHAPSLAAAETANNAAALTSLLPFLLFMVPVQLSEIVLLDIIDMSGHRFTPDWVLQSGIFAGLIFAFFVANVIGVIFAWPLGQKVVSLINRYQRHIVVLSILLMLAAVIQTGLEVGQIAYYVSAGIVLFAIGIWARRWDVVPFVSAFMLAKPMELVFDIAMQKLF
jgi:putative tricarboxylic transport membrane protein